jgi:hypothetical protein
LTTNQEIKVPIDDSFTQRVCDHSVGFLRFKKHGNIESAEPAGTGTFVRFGPGYMCRSSIVRREGPKNLPGRSRRGALEEGGQSSSRSTASLGTALI